MKIAQSNMNIITYLRLKSDFIKQVLPEFASAKVAAYALKFQHR